MKNSTVKKTLIILFTIIALFFIWEIISSLKNNTLVFPSIFSILKKYFEIIIDINNIWIIIKLLLQVLFVALICVILSFLLSVIYTKTTLIDSIIKVLNSIFKSAPFLIIALYLFIVFFNTRSIIPYLITFITLFPLIYEGLMGSLRNYPKVLSDDLALLKGNEKDKFILGMFPVCLKDLTTALLQSIGLGVKVIIMSEYLSNVDKSLGMIIHDAIINIDYTSVLAWLIVIVILVLFIDLFLNNLGKLINKKLFS